MVLPAFKGNKISKYQKLPNKPLYRYLDKINIKLKQPQHRVNNSTSLSTLLNTISLLSSRKSFAARGITWITKALYTRLKTELHG